MRRNNHGPLFRQPSDRRDGHLDHHGPARPRRDDGPADRAVPGGRPADDSGDDHLHRCKRHRCRGVRRDAARTGDQRRREHDLHEVDQRERRDPHAEGVVRGRLEPRHEQRAHAEPREPGVAADAAVGQELRRRGEEGAGVSAAGHLDQVAERQLRQRLSLELHDHQRQRLHRPHPGRRADQPVRRQRLRDARLAAARHHRAAGHHGARHRQCHFAAEPADARRSDWRPPRGHRHGVHVYRPHAGAPAQRGTVREHHRPDQSRMAPRSA